MNCYRKEKNKGLLPFFCKQPLAPVIYLNGLFFRQLNDLHPVFSKILSGGLLNILFSQLIH